MAKLISPTRSPNGRSQATCLYILFEKNGIEHHFLIVKLFPQPRHLNDVTQSLTEHTTFTGQQKNKINSYMSSLSRMQPDHCSSLSCPVSAKSALSILPRQEPVYYPDLLALSILHHLDSFARSPDFHFAFLRFSFHFHSPPSPTTQ